MTATGSTIGTPAYMAPEQAMARDVGPCTDLYAVGCIAYEMLTGAPPFHDADTPMAMMLRHISEPLPPVHEVAGVDQDVSDWVEALTAKDFTARPASSAVASEQLEEILLDKLGPRWRRDSRLGDPPTRSAAPAPSTPAPSGFESFVWRTRRLRQPADTGDPRGHRGRGHRAGHAGCAHEGARGRSGRTGARRTIRYVRAGRSADALTAVPSDRSTQAAPTTPMAGAVTAETIAHSGAPRRCPRARARRAGLCRWLGRAPWGWRGARPAVPGLRRNDVEAVRGVLTCRGGGHVDRGPDRGFAA